MENSKFERLSKMLRQVGATPDDFGAPEPLESTTGLFGEATLDVGVVESMPGEVEIATESLDMLMHGQTEDIDAESQGVLEAIVMPFYRPVVDITDGHMVTTQLLRNAGTSRITGQHQTQPPLL